MGQKRHIDPKHVCSLAQIVNRDYKYLGLTWNECLSFMSRELNYYNAHGGYGAVSDTFLLTANKLGLDK